MLLFYEDFKSEQKFVSMERAITDDDIERFAELTGDFNKPTLIRSLQKAPGSAGLWSMVC